MKKLTAIILACVSLSVFAGERSPSETISRIEVDNNVKCELIKNTISICLGSPRELATCRYKKTYSCYGIESFKVTLKVKEFYSNRTSARETVVTDINYK